MAAIDIKRAAATILSPTIDDNSKLYKKLLGEDYVTLSFEYDSYTEIQVKDYIVWDGVTYTMKQTPEIIKLSEKNYQYRLRFEGPYINYVEALFLLSGEGEFNLTGKAEDFLDQVIVNMNRVYGAGTYTKGSVEATGFKNLYFNNENCFRVLQRICDEYSLEFHFDGPGKKTINLVTQVGVTTGLSFQYHAGLKNIKRQKVSTKDIITQLYAFGSERNIDYNYGAKRLHLPVATYPDGYVWLNRVAYGIREAGKNFDDIYPHFEGVVTSSSSNNKVIDSSIDFNLNDYLIEGVVAKIVFRTGDLSGYEFELISYTNSTKEVYFKSYTDPQGFVVPNGSFNPSVGDEFTFVDITMPPAYVTAAEAELLTAAYEYLTEMAAPVLIYEVAPDWHYLQEGTTSLDIGDLITITDTQLASGGFENRIIELTQSLANQYKYTIKLGDHVPISLLTRTAGERQNIQREIIQKDNETLKKILRGNAINLQTGTSGQRVVIDSADNTIKLYNGTSEAPVVVIDDNLYGGEAALKFQKTGDVDYATLGLSGLSIDIGKGANSGYFKNNFNHASSATRALFAYAYRSLADSIGEIIAVKGLARTFTGATPNILAGGHFIANGGGDINYGVYGEAAYGTVNWAGYFKGNVFINNEIYAPNLPTNFQTYRLVYNTATGRISYYASTSDRRLKENIKPIDGALDKIRQLHGFTFYFNKKGQEIAGQDPKVRSAGLIAQDVKEVLPEAVGEIGDTGYLNIKDEAVTALLVEAIKELDEKVEALKRPKKGLISKLMKRLRK